MARRQATIFINGKEVRRDIKSIAAEKRKLNNELRRLIIGTQEYNEKAAELKKVNRTLAEHRQRLRGLPSAYDKMRLGLNNIIGLTAAAFTVDAIVGYGKQLFELGAQMEVLTLKAQTVFGDTLPQITTEAEANAAAMGLTTAQYVNAAAAIQDLLIPMGFQRQEATNITLQLTNLNGALSEWTGGQIRSEEVARILSKALLGEREELKQLGIAIQEADVKARLAEKGLDKLTGTMLQQAKAAATLELITEKSVDAQTAYANNTDTVVRKQAELQAKLAQIRENLATLLIPIFARLVKAVEPFIDLITRFTQIPVVEKLEEEQAALNLLVSRITEANISQEDRNALIQQLQQKYPDFLGNLGAESVTNEQLAERLRQVNDQYIFKIALQKEDDKIQKAAARLADQQRQLAGKDLEIQQKLIDANAQFNLQLDFTNKSLKERIELTLQSLNTLEAESDIQAQLIGRTRAGIAASGRAVIEDRVEARQKELDTLQQVREEIKKNLAAELGIDLDTQAPTPSTPNQPSPTATTDPKALERLQKQQAKERQLIADQLAQLQEAEAQFREDIRRNTLSEDEQAIELIKQRYQKEIDLATQLEAQGVKEATSRRLELLRLQEEEIEQFRTQQAQQRLNQDLERLETEEEARFQKQFELELAKQDAEKSIRDQVNQALLDEQELQLLQLEEQYAQLLQLANQFGLDSTDLIRAREAEKEKIRESYAQKEKARQAQLASITQDRAEAELATFQELSNGLNQLLSENEKAALGLFLFEKGIAAAEVIINLQKELASIAASNASLGPLAPAVIASLSAAAKVRSAIRLATIAGTAIQGITQKKEGGYFNVTGQDDNRQYRARYIGDPQTGMLPPYPVVLASEAGPEYFVSNKDLRNPKVLNYVQAIDNIRRRRVGQFVEGGATAPLPTTPQPVAPENQEEMLDLLREISSKLDSFNAVLDNDTIIGIIRQYNKLKAAAGGIP